jgi:spermidine/putrescine transport system substrate-binding protein
VKITRRQFIYLAGATAALAAVGGYLWLLPRGGKRTLKIYNYSAYINPGVIKDFEAKYDVKVIYDEYESADEAYAKLQLGGGGYDLVVLTD